MLSYRKVDETLKSVNQESCFVHVQRTTENRAADTTTMCIMQAFLL